MSPAVSPSVPAQAETDAGGILAAITADLSDGAAPNRLLQRFLAPIVRECGAQAGAMRVLSDDGLHFDLVACEGLPTEVQAAERTVGVGCGVCGLAVGTGDVTWSDDLSPCARRTVTPFFGGACQRVLAMPLAHKAQVLGVCNLFFGPGVVLPPQVSSLLKTLGELLGLALHGARLEQQALQAAVMAERQMMAAEVHDTVAQTLAFARMRLPLLEAAVAARDQGAAQAYCADLRKAVTQAHGGLRDVLSHLREPGSTTSLRDALATIKPEMQAQAAVELSVEDHVPELQLTFAQEHQTRRIVQELLNNVVRHAGARHAWLTIERRGNELEILVDDDGQGLPDPLQQAAPQDGEPHFGLAIVRQRAALLRGQIEFSPRAGGGTRVRLHFPLLA